MPPLSPPVMLSLSARLLAVTDTIVVASICRNLVESVELREFERAEVIAEATRTYIRVTPLATAVDDPHDAPDLYRSLAALWLELRFEWRRHNMVANYETVRTGSCAPIVTVRASIASYLLQRIESLLERDHRERLRDTAMELLDACRLDVERSSTTVCA